MIKRVISIFASILLVICSFTLISSADGYISVPENVILENEGVQPLYDIIHSITLDVDEDQVEAVVETDMPASLRITITIYQQKGSGWSFLAKKTFSDYNVILAGTINYNFQPGVTYKAVANFNAGGETDSMEDVFSF